MSGKTQTLLPVVKSIMVACSAEKAFAYFTLRIDEWWPLASHSVCAMGDHPGEKSIFCGIEPKVGGRIFERTSRGIEYAWGNVTRWEPPGLVAFTWHPDRKAETAQTVTVTFKPAGDQTEVTLMHTGWENLGREAEEMRGHYEGGWEKVLGRYQQKAQ